MEESANRRERLKAMREEANQAAIYNNAEDSSSSHSLSNPLIETSGTEPVRAESRGSPRFDYYTDPMSAFSGNRKSSKVSSQAPKDHFTAPSFPSTEILPSPQQQPQMNHQQIYRAQGPTYFPSNSPQGSNLPSSNFNTGHGRGPRFNNIPVPSGGPGYWHGGNSSNLNPGQARPQWFSNSLGPSGNPSFSSGQVSGHPFNNPSPGSSGSAPGMRGFVQGSRPSFDPQQGLGHWSNNNPGIPGSMNRSNPSFNPQQSLGHNSPSPSCTGVPGFVQGSSPSFNYQQGRGHWSNNTPGPGGNFNTQQGRGNRFDTPGYARPSSGGTHWFNQSPGYARPSSGGTHWFNQSPGRGGGRGRGRHNNDVSAEQRPDLYYHKSMVEDPWKLLEPIVWRRENIPSLNKQSWLPESIRMKKVKVMETSTESGSKQSLAEYLAASFNEAVDEELPQE